MSDLLAILELVVVAVFIVLSYLVGFARGVARGVMDERQRVSMITREAGRMYP